jgi:twitching motility protein PilT
MGSAALASMIRENKTFQIPSMMQSGQAQGMQTMDMALERYVKDGTIAPETALEKAIDKESFAKLLKQDEMKPL